MNLLRKYNVTHRNIPIIWAQSFLGGLVFFVPIYALYIEQELGFASSVGIVLTVYAITQVLLEAPTGSFADLYGRKLCVILDFAVSLAALVFLYIGGSIWIFIFAAFLDGVASSLNSGAQSAILYESMKEDGNEENFKKISGIDKAMWPLGAAVGGVVGGYLAAISFKLAVLASAIPWIIGLILVAFFLKEPKHEKDIETSIGKLIHSSSIDILKNPFLCYFFIAVVLLWGLGEPLHEFRPLYHEYKEISIEAFGYFTGAVFLLSSIGHYFAHEISEKLGDLKTLTICAFLGATGVVASTYMDGYAAIVVLTSTSILFGIENSIIEHTVHTHTKSSRRATALSLLNLMRQFAFGIMILLSGYMIDLWDINMTVFMLGVCTFIPAFILLKLYLSEGE